MRGIAQGAEVRDHDGSDCPQLRDDFPEVYRQMGALYLDSSQVAEAWTVFAEALRRYKLARVPEAQLEPFYQDVHAQLVRAHEKKRAAEPSK